MKNDPNLDILRSLAVTIVFGVHFAQAIAGSVYGQRVVFGLDTWALGRLGVLYFFVHTALVLMESMERSKATGWTLAKQFYIRRAFRIYPLSMLLVILVVILRIPENSEAGTRYVWRGFGWLLSNLTLTQNLAHKGLVSAPLWSLPYEIDMYVLLPLLFLGLRTGSAKRLATVYGAGLILGLSFEKAMLMPCFLAGIVAWWLLPRVRKRFPAWAWLPYLLALSIGWGLMNRPDDLRSGTAAVCLLAGLGIPLFHRASGWITRAAAFIAKYSYGIYLWHTPLLWYFYRHLQMAAWQSTAAVLCSTTLVSAVTFHFIEDPLIGIGKRVVARLTKHEGARVSAGSVGTATAPQV